MSLLAIEHDVTAGSARGRKASPSLAGSLTRTRTPQIRLLDCAQVEELQELLLCLDRESRWRRFGHAASDETLLTHARGALAAASCVIGIALDGALRGVLELYSCAPQPFCEAALVVDAQWRRRGLGFALLCAAARWAGATPDRGIRLIFTRDNWPMRKLASKAHARFDLVLGEFCAEIAPAKLNGAK
jgi:GNAT superfamily N-acetyltransferase